jgi:hypothetical protein
MLSMEDRYMKPIILAAIMSVAPAFADTPLATPPAPIPMSKVYAYQPKSPAAISLWPKLTDSAKGEIYQVENGYYFKATDKDTNYEILAIGAYDTLVRQQHLDDKIDERSYITGFLDYRTALGSKAGAAPQSQPKKAGLPWRHVVQGIGYLGMAAGTPCGSTPMTIQRITPANSIAPIYQVTGY